MCMYTSAWNWRQTCLPLPPPLPRFGGRNGPLRPVYFVLIVNRRSNIKSGELFSLFRLGSADETDPYAKNIHNLCDRI